MSAVLVTPPLVEPVTLADAKLHARVDGASQDQAILALITAARGYVEEATGRVLIEQGWRIYRDDWPAAGVVRIRPSPLVRVDAITVYDAEGTPGVVPASDYEIDVTSVPARVRMARGVVILPGREINGIEIDVTAGYGAAAEDVPAPLRQAILMLVAHWFENREAAQHGVAAAEVAHGVSRLVGPYRMVRVA